MTKVHDFFKLHHYDSEDIKDYVKWALDGFRFIYAEPEGRQVSTCIGLHIAIVQVTNTHVYPGRKTRL